MGEYSEQEIQQVLKEVQLYETVFGLKDGVDTDMSNTSSVFSIGQKQLICLARTILRRNSIVVLDEATANIDLKTDELIQSLIKEKFKSNTVFTIAHRINTIADYDKVLVMDRGKVAELDSPLNLLVKSNNKNNNYENNNDYGQWSQQFVEIDQDTIFAEMVRNTGAGNAQQILEIASKKYQLIYD